jgi:hypothetical protein
LFWKIDNLDRLLRTKIYSTFCFWDHGFALGCLSAGPARAGRNDIPSKTETSNADVLAIIENRLERLGIIKEYVVDRERWRWTPRLEASACRPPAQPTSCSATNLSWTVSFIAPWTNWSACNDSGRAKMCRRL